MVSLVVHMFAMGRASHLFWGYEGGLAKTEKKTKQNKTKQNHAREKKEKKLVRREVWKNVYASLACFWDLYNGNVRKKILIFLILFE